MSQAPADAAPVFGHQRTALGETQDASQTNYILIQTAGLIAHEEQQDLITLGVEFLEHLGKGVYLCRYTPKDLDVIRAKPYIKHVDVYRPHFKIHARTQETLPAFDIGGGPSASAPFAEPHTDKSSVVILLHHDLDKSVEQVAQELVEAKLIDENETQVATTQISTLVDTANLAAIAENDSIRAIEPEKEMLWRDAYARSTMTTISYQSGIVNPNKELTGKNQTIAITDSGFDKGTTAAGMNPAFDASRILAFFKGDQEVPLPGNEELKDVSGHGTHVIGCAAGGPIQLAANDPVTSGMAPEANLMIGVKDGGQGQSDRYLNGPYKKGARLFSMSWGPEFKGSQPDYDANAIAIDNFVNKDDTSLICWAAGNDGKKASTRTIISQAAAKNVLTVGNSNSERPGVDPTLKIIVDSGPAENSYVVDETSSTGPTAEDMIKPDVVAPGMRILAARSGAWEQSQSVAIDPYPDPSNRLFAMSGTSQATPLAAGCVALLRQALMERPNAPKKLPSAALMKALIVNGAVQLTPGTRQQYNNREGFGRINMASTLAHLTAPAGWADFQEISVDITQSYAIKVEIPPKGWVPQPDRDQRWHLRATLVWTDPTGEGPQNVLMLQAETAAGDTRYGNVDAPLQGQPQPKPDPAKVNNVQRLDWFDMVAGNATLRVSFLHQAKVFSNWPCAVVWSLESYSV